MSALEFHPLADIFPLLEGQDFAALVADIKAHGLQKWITTYEGKILDGRNRYRACLAAGIEPTFTIYSGDDPVAYVVSLNLRRRHLDESQRAMVAAKLATLKDGQRADLVEGLPIGRAADALTVSERSVARARLVLDKGIPDLIRAVEQGQIAVHSAVLLANSPRDYQRAVVEKVLQDGMRPQEAIRAAKSDRIAARDPAELVGKYRVIYADPPWKYGNTMQDEFREQRDHYRVQSMEEICALPVRDLAEDNAVLFYG
jgi:ParB-like chromosome segregation protein Spo0J